VTQKLTALLITLVALAITTATAVAATPRTSLNDVEDEVMCVSCGVPLNIAESPQATAERNEISKLVDQGLTKQQVKDRLVAQYGDQVLAEPGSDGIGLAAYLVPIVLVLLALGGLAVVVPRWRAKRANGTAEPTAPTGPALSDADARRLDEDLARYKV
jgi:cytochrome c-type biogenesis protein CcmH/NrfF